MSWKIYCVTNSANGKRYVGQTKARLSARWAKHLFSARNSKACGHGTYFSRAIRKYSREMWKYEIIEDELLSIDAANEAEIWWIGHFCSDDNRFGYNSTKGGLQKESSPEILEKTRTKILESLSKKKKYSQYIGVSFDSRQNVRPWKSYIRYKKKYIHCGCFASELEAALAYDLKVKELYGIGAKINFE